MGKSSREKGRRGELEAKEQLPGARKVSRAGYVGPDLIWRDRAVEVKRRHEPLSKKLERFLSDADLVLTRHDGDPGWRVYLHLETLLDLIDEAELDGYQRCEAENDRGTV